MLNSKGETPLINGDQHDHSSQGELTGDNNIETLDAVMESLIIFKFAFYKINMHN